MADERCPMGKGSTTGRSLKKVTCKAPVNIAVVKYWGKRDDDLILPLNSSLSATLNMEELHTVTTVAASSGFVEDCLWLNGRKHDIAELPRIQKCLSQIRELSRNQSDNSSRWKELKDCHVHICSENNFPTAAGLASSAAGYACLVFALSNLFQVRGELSGIARQGSGSACRSMYGGFVKWERGELEDGADCIAKQIATADHWSELRVLILVVNEHKKSTSSTEGMKRSAETSDILKLRAQFCVPQRMNVMEKAIQDRDFKTFAETTMKDSNQLHAVCLDTYPPISPPYMNATSHQIVQMVTQYNNFHQQPKVAYSFDAGPNAVLFLTENDIAQVLALIKHFFPPFKSNGRFIQGIQTHTRATLSMSLLEAITVEPTPVTGAVKYVISTKVGDGPCVLEDDCSLLDDDGFPKS